MARAGGCSRRPRIALGHEARRVEKKSPAAEAGLKEGDVITAVGETDIHRALDFQREMLDRKAGDKLDVTVRRDGKPLNISLVLGEVPEARKRPQQRRLGSPGPGICGPCPPTNSSRSSTPATAAAWWWPTFARTARPPNRESRRRRAGGHAHLGDRFAGQRVLYSQAARLQQYQPVKFFILRGNETLYGFMPVSLKVARQPVT